MVQVANEQLSGNRMICDTHEVAALLSQTPMPSPPMPTVDTVSAADVHALFTKVVGWTINAVRAPPAGGAKTKYKKERGRKERSII